MDGSEVNLFCVLLNSRKAPTREIRENKTPAKYMAYTVFCVTDGRNANTELITLTL